MPIYSQDDQEISDGVNLLISILVRFPEIATIRFDPHHHVMKLTFMLSGILPDPEFVTIRDLLMDSVKAYQMLQGAREGKLDVQLGVYDGISVLTVFRDVDSLSKGEMAMCITLLRERCRDRLVSDSNETLLEEDIQVQEEMIDNMLENVKSTQGPNSLIAIREDGRVLVFNK